MTQTIPLAEAINLRTLLDQERTIIAGNVIPDETLFSPYTDRDNVSEEIDELVLRRAKVTQKEFQRRLNWLAESIRVLDSKIQQVNFTVKVSVDAAKVAPFEDRDTVSGSVDFLIADILSARKSTLAELATTKYLEREDMVWEITERIKPSEGIGAVEAKAETSTITEVTERWMHLMEKYTLLTNTLQKANWDTTVSLDLREWKDDTSEEKTVDVDKK